MSFSIRTLHLETSPLSPQLVPNSPVEMKLAIFTLVVTVIVLAEVEGQRGYFERRRMGHHGPPPWAGMHHRGRGGKKHFCECIDLVECAEDEERYFHKGNCTSFEPKFGKMKRHMKMETAEEKCSKDMEDFDMAEFMMEKMKKRPCQERTQAVSPD